MSDYKKEFDLACEKIVRLEEKNKKLKERVSELEDVSEDYDLLSKDFITLGEENENLKKERDLYKARNEELNENCFWLSKENKKLREERIFSLGEYDYMILTSTTPQLKIIKKNQNYSLMEEDTLQELRDIWKL